MLKIFNTLTKKKEIFIPIYKKLINIYVCGITVYDHCHIGHARTFTIFDMIIKYLRYCKYKVKYIRNITDIDDKIIQSAKLNNENIDLLTNRMIKSMNQDFLNLGLINPDFEPKVTNHIQDIIFMINKLINENYAYISQNGDVVFSISNCKNYGELSKQKINKLKFKNFIDYDNKICKNDFVLWKKLDKLDLPNWNSPWGIGRPGWHIECSAINYNFFGKNVDIHGGGVDLLFPHHENERAQSMCFYNIKNYGKYWIHIGSLLVNNKKMSKSLKNTIFLKNLLKLYNSEVIRYFFLLTHYRKPLLYNINNLNNAYQSLRKLYLMINKVDNIILNKKFYIKYQYFCTNFFNAIDDDFNTPQAISVLFSLLKKIKFLFNKDKKKIAIQLIYQLKYLANVIGLLNQDPNIFLKK